MCLTSHYAPPPSLQVGRCVGLVQSESLKTLALEVVGVGFVAANSGEETDEKEIIRQPPSFLHCFCNCSLVSKNQGSHAGHNRLRRNDRLGHQASK
mmetsp:Transcript_6498/g.17748  ORF Transcript_6498/g.17748 Transcript_6498/m.17748 type:complete len:96 (+) Transcript_6498:2365-2652(+)